MPLCAEFVCSNTSLTNLAALSLAVYGFLKAQISASNTPTVLGHRAVMESNTTVILIDNFTTVKN